MLKKSTLLPSLVLQVVSKAGLTLLSAVNVYVEARGAVVVKALRYKPAGREFDSRWCH
jgi:hypothetical protein